MHCQMSLRDARRLKYKMRKIVLAKHGTVKKSELVQGLIVINFFVKLRLAS